MDRGRTRIQGVPRSARNPATERGRDRHASDVVGTQLPRYVPESEYCPGLNIFFVINRVKVQRPFAVRPESLRSPHLYLFLYE